MVSLLHKPRVLDALLALFLVLQLGFWSQSHEVYPRLEVVPDVPGRAAVQAFSLGDEQFYFRVLGLDLQNFGDTFGRYTPLKDYDYEKLTRWFYLMDTLDGRSHMIPSLAAYYFSQTQHPQDVRYIVKYLSDHYWLDPEHNWWWLGQAVSLANHVLGDKKWALELAYTLSKTPGKAPLWVRQMPAFIHEQLGERESALAIITAILDSYEKQEIGDGELNFMRYFIEKRLKMLEEYEKQQEAKRAVEQSPIPEDIGK